MANQSGNNNRDPKGFYKRLGITPNATSDEIKKAYKKAAMQHHPDRNDHSQAKSNFQQINDAYKTLGDPSARKNYDKLANSAGFAEAHWNANMKKGNTQKPKHAKAKPQDQTNPLPKPASKTNKTPFGFSGASFKQKTQNQTSTAQKANSRPNQLDAKITKDPGYTYERPKPQNREGQRFQTQYQKKGDGETVRIRRKAQPTSNTQQKKSNKTKSKTGAPPPIIRCNQCGTEVIEEKKEIKKEITLVSRRKLNAPDRRSKDSNYPPYRCRRKLGDKRGYYKNKISFPEESELISRYLLILEEDSEANKELMSTLYTAHKVYNTSRKKYLFVESNAVQADNLKSALAACQKYCFSRVFVSIDADFALRMAFITKMLETWPKTRVIVCSADASVMKLAILKENGIKDFIVKPYNLEKLTKLML